MICPECQKEGKKSKVYIGPSIVTAAHYAPYYDEEGAYHHHDASMQSASYQCSNNHEWDETPPDCNFCPNPKCKWPEENEN